MIAFDKPTLVILANLLASCDSDVLHENVASDGLVDLTPSMLAARCDELAAAIYKEIAQPDVQLEGEKQVLRTLLEFHTDDDLDAYYPTASFNRLCDKMGVKHH